MNKELKHIKTTGFKTPKGYFDTLEDQVMSTINLKETLHIDAPGFKIPKGYFDTLEDSVLSNLSDSTENKNVINLFSRKTVYYALSIAATILILIMVVLPSNPTFDSLKLETVENFIYEESFSSEEIAALLSEEELESLSLTETIYTEESLEDYILDYTSIEDLIIE
ncbi:MAG: hypothetical protein HKO92_05765 [Flavobacteriaceae bacterium]|nr:hypothetical protein [Flavobacteriaceae bacterium]